MRNQDIRKAIKDAELCHWQIAEALGISDGYFSVILRRELSDKKKKRILNIIDKLSKEDE